MLKRPADVEKLRARLFSGSKKLNQSPLLLPARDLSRKSEKEFWEAGG